MQGRGFILSKRVVTRQRKSIVETWVATDSGPMCLHSPYQQPVCFILAQDAQNVSDIVKLENLSVEIVDSHLKTLQQNPVKVLKSRDDSTHYQLRRALQKRKIDPLEADIKLSDRFLMERFIYGSVQFVGKRQEQNGVIIETQFRPTDYKPPLSYAAIDIECDEHENLYSIAIASDALNKVILINTDAALSASGYDLQIVESERQLLLSFVDTISQLDPDILLGWNVKQFDFAVLDRRAKRLGISLKLGRGNNELTTREWEQGQVIADIPGRCIIDGIDALKTMTYSFERFSLDFVANSLLGKGKLIDDTEDKLATIKNMYRSSPLELARYNLEDCVLVNEIAQKTQFIDFLMLRAKLTGLDMSRPGGSVAAFLNVYLPKLHRAGYVSNNRPEHGGLASPGGYVMNSKPGLYEHVLVLDFKSLYPSIIRTFKIDPLGLAQGILSPDTAIPGFKGALFSRNEHFLPDIIRSLWQQRDEAKKQNDGPRSQAIKILMNSFYGVLGSGGCPLYNPQLASSITMRGHEIMQQTAKWITEQGYDVIYGDTDSTFVHIANVQSGEQAKAIGVQLQDMVNQRWREKLRDEFNLDCYLELEFETHYERFFMPTIRGTELGSKKRYAGLIKQGNRESIVFKGLENVRSDWTPLAKRFQETLYQLIFANQDVNRFITQTIQQLRNGQLDQELVYSRRLRKPLSHYTKTVPPHVKAARLADEENDKRGKPLKYQNKGTIRYIMTTQGPQPIEYQQSPIDYEHYIEKQVQPIADSILPQIDLAFSSLDEQQLSLFQ